MNNKYPEWKFDNTETELIVTHSESQHVFRFLKTEKSPHLSTSPIVRINSLAKHSAEALTTEAYNAAINYLTLQSRNIT